MNASVGKFLDKSPIIQDICRPLFLGSAINGLSYIKIVNNRLIYLCSSNTWLSYFFEKDYQNLVTTEHIPELFTYQYVIGHALPHRKISLEAEEQFNFAHIFSINFLNPKEKEFFIFSSEKENEYIENWYINNIQQLQQFCMYFKSFLGDLEKNLSPILIYNTDTELSTHHKQTEESPNLIQDMASAKKIWLGDQDTESYITPHELKYLKLLFEGKNAHEIADKVHRSVRTIETHIQNIKRKFHCSKRSELIQKIIDNKLHHFFIKI